MDSSYDNVLYNEVRNPKQQIDIIIVLITTPLDNKELPLEILHNNPIVKSGGTNEFFKKQYDE